MIALPKNVIILAAGRGSRLMPYTCVDPKCLVEIGNKPILWYQLSACNAYGIRNVTIVTGYRADAVRRFAQNEFPHFSFQFIHNKQYEFSSDAFSFYLAAVESAGDSIQMNSDVLFHPNIIFEMLSGGENALCLRRGVCGEEEMKVCADEQGRVVQYGKHLDSERADGESIGIHFFSNHFMRSFREMMLGYVSSGDIDVDKGTVFSDLIRGGADIRAVDITRYPAIEIDFPEDIIHAEKMVSSILDGFKRCKSPAAAT